jgi:hypothetical protein
MIDIVIAIVAKQKEPPAAYAPRVTVYLPFA